MAKTMPGRKAVNFTETQDAMLEQIARDEGCSVSALIRRAAIRQFGLPTDAPERSTTHQNGAQLAHGQRPEAEAVKDGELAGGSSESALRGKTRRKAVV